MECDICNKSFTKKSSLKRHLINLHGYKVKSFANVKDSLMFESFTEFLDWKNVMEQETCSSYIKNRGPVRCANGDVHMYYDCCRSGTYKPKIKKGVRSLKSQQSKKIGSSCPAKIHVKIKEDIIFVNHFKQHDKHAMQIEHLNLSSSIRYAIAEKIKEGLSIDHIINDIREHAANNNIIDRSTIIDRRDILNIKRDMIRFNFDNKIERSNHSPSIKKEIDEYIVNMFDSDATSSQPERMINCEEKNTPTTIKTDELIDLHSKSNSGSDENEKMLEILKTICLENLERNSQPQPASLKKKFVTQTSPFSTRKKCKRKHSLTDPTYIQRETDQNNRCKTFCNEHEDQEQIIFLFVRD